MKPVNNLVFTPLIGLFIFSMSANPISAHAETTDEKNATETNHPVTVYGDPLAITSATRSTALTDEEDLRKIQPKSVAEAVKHHANVTVAGGSRPNSQTVNIRGLEGNRILQTIDGVRQVFESGHRPSYLLDPSLLKEVEVVKGPASSIWGSGALGGVIAQRTINATDVLEGDQTFGGFVKSGVNTNNHESNNVVTLAGQANDFDWLFNANYRDSDDFQLGNDEALENSASQNQGMMVKGNWQLDEGQSLRFNFRAANNEGAVPSNGSSNVTSSNFLINRDQSTKNLSLGYSLDTNSPLVNADAIVYWNNVVMDEDRVSDGRTDGTDLDVYGIKLNNIANIDGIQIIYGVDGYQEQFNAEREGGASSRPNPPDGTTTVAGVFSQASIPLNDSWSLEVGGRYDYFETEADNLGSRSDSAFSPSAALIWDISETVALTLRHDRSFRAPSSEELYTTGTHFCMGPGFCNTFTANPDLEAEKAANTELAIAANFGSLNRSGLFGIEAAVFHNKVDDYIEQVVEDPNFMTFDPGTTTWINVDTAVLVGGEIAFSYEYDALQAKVSYGITHGKDDNTDEDLTNIPADTLKADVSYGFTNNFRAGFRLTHARDMSRTDNDDVSTDTYDGYTITDLYASWQPASVDGLSVDLTVNNLSDQHYRQAWAQLDEPGREVIASVRYDF